MFSVDEHHHYTTLPIQPSTEANYFSSSNGFGLNDHTLKMLHISSESHWVCHVNLHLKPFTFLAHYPPTSSYPLTLNGALLDATPWLAIPSTQRHIFFSS